LPIQFSEPELKIIARWLIPNFCRHQNHRLTEWSESLSAAEIIA